MLNTAFLFNEMNFSRFSWNFNSYSSFTIANSNIVGYISMNTTNTLGRCNCRLCCIVGRLGGIIGCVTILMSIVSITSIHGHHHMCWRWFIGSSTCRAVDTGWSSCYGWITMFLLWLLFHASIIRCNRKLQLCVLNSRSCWGTTCWFRLTLGVWRMNDLPISILIRAYLKFEWKSEQVSCLVIL